MNNLPIILIAVGAAGFIAMNVAGKTRRVYEKITINNKISLI